MQQHPVPQNISSYEFRLVGDMTLKQFFQLAGGFLVAFILYKTPLVGILKWPLMFISGLTGVLMAFVPVNGRPFSQWILAFIHAIYSPTRFVWNSQKTVFEFSKDNRSTVASAPADTSTLPLSGSSTLDKFESQLFSRFSDLFAGKNPFNNTQPSMPNPSTSSGQVAQAVIVDTPTFSSQPLPTPPVTPLTPIFSHSPISVSMNHQPTNQLTNTLSIPETPNIVSGVVTNAQNASVESAIIEITDTATGIPVRALRTNKLGQFKIATPVGNGKYQITTEKDGLNFETVIFEANGKIINPIQIVAKL